jgi:hypothetical protein
MEEWSTRSGGRSGPQAEKRGRLLTRVDSRMQGRLNEAARAADATRVRRLNVSLSPG